MASYSFILLLLFCLNKINSKRDNITYNYINGGDDWTGLCQTGEEQSPIDISETSLFQNTLYYLSDLHNNIGKLNEDSNQYQITGLFSKSFFNDEFNLPYFFNMTEIFVHSPSEHKINGKGFDLEIQFQGNFINGQENQKYSMHNLAVFFNQTSDQNTTNKFIEQIINLNSTIDSSSLIEDDLTNHKIYYYIGSITKPPCTENVFWSILSTPFNISSTQLKFFKDKWENNKEFANGRGNNRNIRISNKTKVYVNGGEF